MASGCLKSRVKRPYPTGDAKGDISQVVQAYYIVVRKPVPRNLSERVSALHASALIRLETAPSVRVVGDADYGVTKNGNNIKMPSKKGTGRKDALAD